MVRRYIFSLALLTTFIIGCQDIPRDNLLDPKNDSSYQASTLLLEAFVNTTAADNYNLWALQALDSIKELYGKRVVIAEYHRDSSPYASPVFENLYDKYVDNSTDIIKGVPDIFLNGVSARVQGASAAASVVSRLNAFLSDWVVRNNYFTLEAEDVKWDDSEISAACRIARLGSEPAEDILLKMIALKQVNSGQLKRVALGIEKSVVISKIEAGEIKTEDFEMGNLSSRPDKVIFCLTSSDELHVYQSIEVNIQ